MSNLSTGREFSLAPTTFAEATKFAEMIAQSDFCPKEMRGKPGNVMVAMQFGAEVGLPGLQALQNIAVINGKPSIYGDAALAVIRAHPRFASIHERDPGEALTKGEGRCEIQTRDGIRVVRTFSTDEAKKANLWSKPGPWSQYPGRMLQMRARSFAMRDALPEALKGLSIREEVEDFGPPVIATTKPDAPAVTTEAPAEQASTIDVESTPRTLCEELFDDAVGRQEATSKRAEMSDDEKTLIGLRERIEAAEDRAALAVIGTEIKDLSQAIRDAIKPAYAARYKELQS